MPKQPKKTQPKKIEDKPTSNHSDKETVSFAWCDSGMVEGRFASGLLNTLLESQRRGIRVTSSIRVQGNQIARQRQSLIDYWYDNMASDWLMWIDSDIVMTIEAFQLLWDSADKISKPLVAGVYFVSQENEQSLMEPTAAVYMNTDSPYVTRAIHPLPQNQLIPIDVGGFGFVLMHRSIVPKVREVAGEFSVFGENQQAANKFISEDVSFFRKAQQAGIQAYAHTGAHVAHLKTFSYDINYYNMYWTGVAEGKIKRKQDLGKQK
jgi:hypothetical protein